MTTPEAPKTTVSGKGGLWRFVQYINYTFLSKSNAEPLRVAYNLTTKCSLFILLIGEAEEERGYCSPSELHHWWVDYTGRWVSRSSTNSSLTYLRDERKLVDNFARGKWKLTETGWWAYEKIRERFFELEEKDAWV